jgi:hypothetical protein
MPDSAQLRIIFHRGHMPLPSTKSELLESLKLSYMKLDSEFDVINPENERRQGIEGNVSCCDIVSYQVGWANLLMGWEQQESEGKTPEMPAKGFKWNQLGDLAQSFYDKNSKKSLSQLRVELKESYHKLVTWIESLTEQELFEPHQRKWTGDKWAIVKWVQVNSIAPYRSARTKIRRWKKENVI